ncbi:hypothetical protein IWQ60_012557, partial [Tieghemiomyces parasiticus]
MRAVIVVALFAALPTATMGSPVGSSQGSSLNGNQDNFGDQNETAVTQPCYLFKLPNELIHRALENLVKKSDQDQASLTSKGIHKAIELARHKMKE